MSVHRRRTTLLLLTSILWCVLATLQIPGVDAQAAAGTACTQPRVRKSWHTYTQAEQTLYLEAVGLAMKKGYHQKFVQLHIESYSEKEAHQNCMFIYWHRMYLLGYENMLRSLDPKYACVTIPVWDHLTATAIRAANKCQYMEGCAPIIKDFGGSTKGLAKNLIVYDVTISRPTGGTCVNQGVAGNFCGNNTGCANCIVRGTAYKTDYPGSAYFGSVYQQVFTYNTWKEFASGIESGVHNSVHSALGGTMAYFQSPVDPLFYSHHAFIDALQTIYLKCQLQSDMLKLTSTQKYMSSTYWSNCTRRSNGNSYTPTDEVTMATWDYAKKWVHVRRNSNNTLYPFFKDLPPRFVDYVDAKDLGVYSYTYNFTGGLANMFANCKDSTTITSATLLADEEADKTNEAGENEASVRPSDSTASDVKERRWAIAIYESARLHGYTEDAARVQMEMVTCMYKHECIGTVQDYSSLFRKNFGVQGHPRCFTLVKAIRNGDKVIGIPHWRKITGRFVSCPNNPKYGSK